MTYTQEQLTNKIQRIFEKVNLTSDQAREVANHLVYAEMHGIKTHGTLQIKDYVTRINEGYINLDPKVTYKQTSNNTILVDADNGMGMPIALDAMNKGIDLMKDDNGIVMVGVKNINHTGTMSYYLNKITQAGYVGMCFCITAALAAPYGGTKAYLGTNPFGFGAPIKDDYPFILDMATTTSAYGKVLVAKAKNEQIPLGWGLDKDGLPTTNPSDVVLLTPFGGAKGYGLMLMINILAGVMLDTESGDKVPKYYNDDKTPNKLTHVFVIIDPKSYLSEDDFLKDMATMKKEINSQSPGQGFDEVLIPGQRAFREYEKSIKEGISLLPKIEDYLNKLED